MKIKPILRLLFYTLIGLSLFFYNCSGEKVVFFEGNNFNEDTNWLFVRANTDYDTYEVIYDKEVLQKLRDDLVLQATKECGGTTPDNCLDLYKNSRRVNSFCYCSWESMSFAFGRLESKFIPAKQKLVSANSIDRYHFVLDSLKKENNVYLLYPKDTTVQFSGQLEFDVKLIDKDQDIFEQEKPLEETFRKVFNKENYKVKADWYLSEVGSPRKLGYHIKVDCDSSFLKYFDVEKLKQHQLFQEMSKHRYSNKEFKIYYYDWNK
ncbi:hypothetical protein [Bernardetia sp.]|uniref:hypothetical protein n=1 Tax=Bernardetia sp. TaxID=1937974 RepID=UPI0025C37A6E|nr:hypothetical protein [Bernardetia sp.]